MGLPFVVLNMVSAVLYKDLGISDAQIAFWTSLIMWPWTIKFLWSPFLELYRTKKFWVVGSQLLSGVLFGVAALSLHLPLFFSVSVAVFAVVAFSGATHDIAADGVYMSELSTGDQARYIGWQGAFYNLAKLVATGGLVWFAGWLGKRFSDSGAATFDACVQSWTVVRAVWCGLRGGFTRVSAPRGPHRSTLMSVRGRSFCCSCASRSSLWAFTISARFLQAVRLQKAARCGMAFRA